MIAFLFTQLRTLSRNYNYFNDLYQLGTCYPMHKIRITIFVHVLNHKQHFLLAAILVHVHDVALVLHHHSKGYAPVHSQSFIIALGIAIVVDEMDLSIGFAISSNVSLHCKALSVELHVTSSLSPTRHTPALGEGDIVTAPILVNVGF